MLASKRQNTRYHFHRPGIFPNNAGKPQISQTVPISPFHAANETRLFLTQNTYFLRFADRESQYIYLSNEPNWCTKFLFYSKFISYPYMFRAHASGIITPIGVMIPEAV